MNPNLERECKDAYYTLYAMLGQKKCPAQKYLFELSLTERCDTIFDLREVRKATEDFVGKSTMKRINARLVPSVEDYIAAESALTHYREWHRRELRGVLNFSQRLRAVFDV